MAEFPSTPLQTEPAIQVAQLVEKSGYQLEVTPRAGGADLAAAREGTVWATFHIDVDPKRPLLLVVGATVWGGARQNAAFEVPWDGTPDERLADFVRQRLELACRKGRSQDPDHCADCPLPGHRPR